MAKKTKKAPPPEAPKPKKGRKELVEEVHESFKHDEDIHGAVKALVKYRESADEGTAKDIDGDIEKFAEKLLERSDWVVNKHPEKMQHHIQELTAFKSIVEEAGYKRIALLVDRHIDQVLRGEPTKKKRSLKVPIIIIIILLIAGGVAYGYYSEMEFFKDLFDRIIPEVTGHEPGDNTGEEAEPQIILEEVLVQISFQPYLDNAQLYNNQQVTLTGFLGSETEGKWEESGIIIVSIYDDFGNSIQLKGVTYDPDLMPRDARSQNLYNVTGVLKRKYGGLDIQVDSMVRTSRPVKKVERIVS